MQLNTAHPTQLRRPSARALLSSTAFWPIRTTAWECWRSWHAAIYECELNCCMYLYIPLPFCSISKSTSPSEYAQAWTRTRDTSGPLCRNLPHKVSTNEKKRVANVRGKSFRERRKITMTSQRTQFYIHSLVEHASIDATQKHHRESWSSPGNLLSPATRESR